MKMFSLMIFRQMSQRVFSKSRIENWTDRLLMAKSEQNLTFQQIARHLNRNEVWVASLIYNQQSATANEAHKLLELLKIVKEKDAEELKSFLTCIPIRGDHEAIHDPAVYRMQELIAVNGRALKAIVNEKFGDGIMSSVDCTLTIRDRLKSNGERRVVIEIDGKYLPYKSEP